MGIRSDNQIQQLFQSPGMDLESQMSMAPGAQQQQPQMSPAGEPVTGNTLTQAVQNVLGQTQAQMQAEEDAALEARMKTPADYQPPDETEQEKTEKALGLGPAGGGPTTSLTQTIQQTQGVPSPEATALMRGAVGEVNKAQREYEDALLNIKSAMDTDDDLKQLILRRDQEISQIVQDLDERDASKFLNRIAGLREQQDQALERASREMDPDSWLKSRSTGQKVLGGLGLLLGSVGSALGGGPNIAWQIIDDAIARDINAQQFNIDQARKEAADFGSRIDSELAWEQWRTEKKLEALNMYDAMIARKTALYEQKAKTAEQQRSAMLASAQAKERLAQSTRALIEAQTDRAITTTKITADEQKAKLGDRMKMRALQTNFGYAFNDKGAEKMRAVENSYEYSMAALDRMQQFLTENGVNPDNWTEKGQASAMSNEFIPVMQALQQSGVLNPSEFDRFVRESPISTGLIGFKTNSEAQGFLDEFRRVLRNVSVSTLTSNAPRGSLSFPKTKTWKSLEDEYNKRIKKAPTRVKEY